MIEKRSSYCCIPMERSFGSVKGGLERIIDFVIFIFGPSRANAIQPIVDEAAVAFASFLVPNS